MTRAPRPSPAPAVNEIAARDADTPVASANNGGHSEAAAPLSAAERRKRMEAVRFANATIGLEGLNVSAAAHARAERYIAGEIDLAEFLQID